MIIMSSMKCMAFRRAVHAFVLPSLPLDPCCIFRHTFWGCHALPLRSCTVAPGSLPLFTCHTFCNGCVLMVVWAIAGAHATLYILNCHYCIIRFHLYTSINSSYEVSRSTHVISTTYSAISAAPVVVRLVQKERAQRWLNRVRCQSSFQKYLSVHTSLD